MFTNALNTCQSYYSETMMFEGITLIHPIQIGGLWHSLWSLKTISPCLTPKPFVITAQTTRLHPPRTLLQDVCAFSPLARLPSASHIPKFFHIIYFKIVRNLFLCFFFLHKRSLPCSLPCPPFRLTPHNSSVAWTFLPSLVLISPHQNSLLLWS